MGYQLVFRWPTGERIAPLDDSMVVGRDAGCDVSIESVRLSRRHAEFALTPQGVSVRDLGSRNGVVINGSRVEHAILEPTDRVLLGDVSVTIGIARATQSTPVVASSAVEPATHSSAPTVPSRAPDTAPVALDSPATRRFSTGLGALVAPPAAPGTAALETPLGVPQHQPIDLGTGPLDRTTILPAGVVPTLPPPARSAQGAATDTSPPLRKRRFGLDVRLAAAVLAGAFCMFLVTAIPLVRAQNRVVRAASLARVSTIARALGTENGAALAAGQTLSVGVQDAMLEPGVREALLVSPEGRVLAPAASANTSVTSFPAFGAIADLQGVQSAELNREVQAVAVIEAGGRRVGVAWVRLDPSYTAGSGSVPLYLTAAFFTGLAAAAVLAFLLRKAVRNRLESFATDIDLAASGQLDVVTESLGMPKLAESVNFVIRRMRAKPSTAVPVAAAASAPATPSGVGLGEGHLVLDSAFIVQQADAGAAQLLRIPRDQIEGQHVLSAIPEQGLVTAMIDAIGDIGETGESVRRVAGSATQPELELRTARQAPGGPIHLAIRRVR